MSLTPPPNQPAVLPASPPPVAASSVRLPMAAAVAMVALGAALIAALVSWALTVGLGASSWAAPMGALLGVAASVLPAALLLQRLMTRQDRQPLMSGSLNTPLGAARPLFLELAGREWARARRYGSGAAVLLVDVDRFARLTESSGSEAADSVMDELLRQTAPTLRGADLITRFGESQMAVFLSHADPTGALDVAERIRDRAEQLEVALPQEATPKALRLTVSIGVAQLRPAHLNLQSLIDDAQDAVLAARQAGGNCVRAAPVDLGRLSPTGGWRTEPRARP